MFYLIKPRKIEATHYAGIQGGLMPAWASLPIKIFKSIVNVIRMIVTGDYGRLFKFGTFLIIFEAIRVYNSGFKNMLELVMATIVLVMGFVLEIIKMGKEKKEEGGYLRVIKWVDYNSEYHKEEYQ